MKKTFLIIFLGLLFVPVILNSCDENTKTKTKAPESKRMELDSTSQYSDQNYKVYSLEGCEYVVVGYGKDRWGSHKGNCRNSIHQTPDTTGDNYCNK